MWSYFLLLRIYFLQIEGADGLSGAGYYHAGVGFGDAEAFGDFVKLPAVAVAPVEYLAVSLGEMGADETVDFGYLFAADVVIVVGGRMAFDGIYIGFGMGLPAALPVDGDVAGSHRQESFGFALRREVGATGPQTAEGFLEGVFVIVGASGHQPAAH